MTNAEKFKTAEERAKAFEEFCFGRNCDECVMYLQNGKYSVDVCLAFWLDLEAEEEKPLPCPGCGNERMCVHDKVQDPKIYIVCPDCGYRAPCGMNIEDAVKRHNSLARAALGGSK